MPIDPSQDIRDRAFALSCLIVRLARNARPGAGAVPIVNQLVRAGTSVGANLEEAKAASTRREFVRYVEISLRSARETVYWLRICRSVALIDENVDVAIAEGDQITRILAAIVISTKRRMIGGMMLFAFCILHSSFCTSHYCALIQHKIRACPG